MRPLSLASPWGGRGFYLETTQSTMVDALALESRGEPDGSFVMAGEQTQGRGRWASRRWLSSPGDNLLVTFFLSPHHFACPTFAPSLVLGLGVCLWLESLGLTPRLKWPNDVLLPRSGGNWGKLCGILVSGRWVSGRLLSLHCGLGVNLRPVQATQFPRPPVSLEEWGVCLDPTQALAGLFPYLALAVDGPHPRDEVQGRLCYLGQETEVTTPQGAVRGTVRGLGAQGELLLETSGGMQALTAGE